MICEHAHHISAAGAFGAVLLGIACAIVILTLFRLWLATL